jgi:disulfide bond formation protein DsbB
MRCSSMVAMAATVGGALAFQHIGGYIPCKLCYEQRMAVLRRSAADGGGGAVVGAELAAAADARAAA